ncbi:MAG TPA: trigger factor [Rubricoccaceae bacterium]|nr:trigger factor [Rubricoccaceae bacterium]
MQTSVTPLSDVEYALDVHVSRADLAPRVDAVLKKQRASLNLKGFRPGRVPLSHVRKMVGPQVAYQIAEEVIGEAYRTAVAENEGYDVLGQPRLAHLDYDPEGEGDLHAVVHFGVRPQFELAQLEGVPVTKLVRTFTDEDVAADLRRRLDLAAALEDAPEGAALTESDVAIVDIQPVDAEGNPAGPVQHGAQFLLSDPSLREEIKGALLGAAAGQTVRVDLPHHHADDDPHAHDHDDHTDRYALTVAAVRHRRLPEMDAAFVREQTGGRTEDLDELKAEVRASLERSWERRAREAMEAKMVEQFVEAHTFPIPETLVDTTLDAMLDEVRERNEGHLPPGFDVQGWRDARRDAAAAQVRWLLVKDKLIHEEGLEVTNEDFEAEFEKLAGENVPAEAVRHYFAQQPRLLEQLGDQLLNRRVFASLEKRFEVVEKTREDLEREAAERRAADEARREEEAAAARAAEEAAKPKKRFSLFGRKKEE